MNELDDEAYNKSPNELSRQLEEVAAILSTEASSNADIIAARSSIHLRKEDPSTIAASIIYLTRKTVFTSRNLDIIPRVPNIWPKELILLTRCSEA